MPDAKKWLNGIDAPSAFVVVCGKRRIGKSTSLEQFTDQMGGFGALGKSESITKGLWILPKTFKG
jgi:hypothetical protein